MMPLELQKKILDLWLAFEKGLIDEQDLSIGISDLLKPIYWEQMKNDLGRDE